MTLDPYPALVSDSQDWNHLFQLTWDTHLDYRGIHGLLNGIRCLGARLVWNNGWRIDKGDIDDAEWASIRQAWMLPQRDQITALLARLPH